MYAITIKNDGVSTVIHEPGSSGVKVEGAQVSREVNKFDSLTFSIYPGNPGYDALVPFSTLIEIVDMKTGNVAFDGRVIQPVPSMDSDGMVMKSVTCESVMGYLCDSLQMREDEQHYSDQGQTSGLRIFIGALLDRHNAAVEDAKKIYPGEITLQTFETSGGVTKAIDRASTWDNISSKLLYVFGGEMRVRRASDGKLYLDYKEALGTTRATAIRVAWNMTESESTPDLDSVITRLYPYGCKLKEAQTDPETGETSEVETEERLTIESVNQGIPYIDDAVAIERYGIIEGYHEWDDVTQPANLLSKAQAWLGQNNALPVSHSISALDLSLLGLDPDSFELFDKYPCRNPLTGMSETLEIVKLTLDISSPEESTFEMGDSQARLSADIAQGATQGDIQKVESQVQTSITNVSNRVTSTWAAITVASDRISQQVAQQVQQSISEITASLSDAVQAAQAAAESAQAAADAAAGQAAQEVGITGGNADVLIQPNEPASSYRKGTTLWIDTTDGANTPKMWDGAAWTAIADPDAEAAADAAVSAKEEADEAWAAVDQATKDALAGINGDISDLTQQVTSTVNQMTQLVQDMNSFTFNFTELEETVTEISGQVSTEYTERLKYIKFINGEIWLGRDPDPGQDDFKVVISNERIRFLRNNIEIAYISGSKLYITDAQILGNLEIGNFAWIPRSNGGMSLRYNG